jgi:hypothetical protein
VDAQDASWCDRTHFFAVAAQVMRRILVDGARARASAKRGGDVRRLNLNESLDGVPARDPGPIALDDALDALAQDRRPSLTDLDFSLKPQGLDFAQWDWWLGARKWPACIGGVPRDYSPGVIIAILMQSCESIQKGPAGVSAFVVPDRVRVT